jgi:hypothetical protein
MGIKNSIPLSTLSDANVSRPWEMYQDLAFVLIVQTQKLYGKDELTESIKILVSSTIDYYLLLFQWAELREHKKAIKLHTMMDLKGYIPTFKHISDGRMHDVHIMCMIPILPGSIYIMDRGY